MKKLMLSLAIILSAIFILQAQNEAVSNAIITFEKTTHDFGTVVEGPQASYDFEFTNTGTEPLIISNCKASCGCTVTSCPKEPILPGHTGTINASYNTRGRIGSFNKSVTVNSNAKNPRSVVYIKGNVVKEAQDPTTPVKPPSLLKENIEGQN